VLEGLVAGLDSLERWIQSQLDTGTVRVVLRVPISLESVSFMVRRGEVPFQNTAACTCPKTVKRLDFNIAHTTQILYPSQQVKHCSHNDRSRVLVLPDKLLKHPKTVR